VAKRMRLLTTKRGVNRMIHPSMSKRFKTNYRQLRHHCLPLTCFTDTMFFSTKSIVRNKAVKVWCSANGWKRAFPMKKENEAHEALSLLFHIDGVPNMMVMDGSKDQVQGDFRRKLRDMGCHIKQTEHYTAWSNLGKGGV
jgi:hypothetical protein